MVRHTRDCAARQQRSRLTLTTQHAPLNLDSTRIFPTVVMRHTQGSPSMPPEHTPRHLKLSVEENRSTHACTSRTHDLQALHPWEWRLKRTAQNRRPNRRPRACMTVTALTECMSSGVRFGDAANRPTYANHDVSDSYTSTCYVMSMRREP